MSRAPNHDTIAHVMSVLRWAEQAGYKVVPGYTVTNFEGDDKSRVYIAVQLQLPERL
jgi:hypothetical protein